MASSKNGRVNSELTDIAWYRVENGVEGNALVTTPKKYVITSSGNDAGKLLWYINGAQKKPILLRFKAKFLGYPNQQGSRHHNGLLHQMQEWNHLQADAAVVKR